MPEYKVSTLYLGTKVGTGSLCSRVFRRFRGVLPRSTTSLLLQHLASADGAKWTKDNLGTQSVDKAPFCTVPGELVPVNAPLDRDGDSFDSGSYQQETCTQN